MLANSLWSDGEFLRQTEVAEQYADSVNLSLVRLDSALAQPVAAHNPGFSIPNRTDGLPKLKLPQIQFPKFSGKPEKYREFINSFESILNKFILSSFEK